MAKAEMVVKLRCERCTCGDPRKEALRDAVVEAARQFVAQVHASERRHKQSAVWPEHGEAFQTLRDCLVAQRVARG